MKPRAFQREPCWLPFPSPCAPRSRPPPPHCGGPRLCHGGADGAMRTRDADPFAGRARSSGRRGAEQEVRTACRPCGRAAQGGREGFTGRQRGWSRDGERRGRNVEATGVSSRRKRRTQGEFSGTWTKGRFTGSRLAVVSKSQNMRQRRMCYVPTTHKSIFLSPSFKYFMS